MKSSLAAILTLLFTMIAIPEATATNLCELTHRKAVSKCSVYKHEVDAESLYSLSQESRTRAAKHERNRTLSFGRSCALAQKLCAQTCASLIAPTIEKGGDWGKMLDLSSDCREGEVASHRRELVKRYEVFSRMSESKVAHNHR